MYLDEKFTKILNPKTSLWHHFLTFLPLQVFFGGGGEFLPRGVFISTFFHFVMPQTSVRVRVCACARACARAPVPVWELLSCTWSNSFFFFSFLTVLTYSNSRALPSRKLLESNRRLTQIQRLFKENLFKYVIGLISLGLHVLWKWGTGVWAIMKGMERIIS